MKKFSFRISLVLLLFLTKLVVSQNKIVLPVLEGPNSNRGGIYTVDTLGSSNGYMHVFSAARSNGTNKTNTLVENVNGKIYGITAKVLDSEAEMFEFDPLTNIYRRIDKINLYPGLNDPNGELVQCSNGKIYGTARANTLEYDYPGGIIEYNPLSDSLNQVAIFRNNEPRRSNLLGTSNINSNYSYLFYGYSNPGMICKLNTVTGTIEKIHGFNPQLEGELNRATLAEYNGKVYSFSSSENKTYLFSIEKSNDQFMIEREISPSELSFCYSLTQESSNTWIGLGYNGTNYMIFRLNLATLSITELFVFDTYASDCYPTSPVYIYGDKLYGYGALSYTHLQFPNQGVIYSYDMITHAFSLEKILDRAIYGAQDVGSGLYNGKLFVATSFDGINNQGSFFEYDIQTDSASVIINYGDYYDTPTNAFLNSNNKFVFNSEYTGTFGFGSIYEYDPNGMVFTEKFAFQNPADGRSPEYYLFEMSQDRYIVNLGMGGINGLGNMQVINTSNNSFTVLYEYSDLASLDPVGDLLEYNGSLYGVCSNGVIYKMDLSDNKITDLANLNTINGSNPKSGLTLAANGKFYGTCSTGGANNFGLLYEFDPADNSLFLKINFNGAALGKSPVGKMILGTDNKLYGLTQMGGTSDFGTLYSYNPATNILTRLRSLGAGAISGKYPNASLSILGANELVGTLSAGGVSFRGSLFKYNYVSNVFSELAHNTYSTGSFPKFSPLVCSNSKIYGLTHGYDTIKSTIYAYDIVANSQQAVYKYQDYTLGKNPIGVYNFNGKYYSFVSTDGLVAELALWEQDPVQSMGRKIVLWNTTSTMGSNVHELIMASDGFWYVVTSQGGANGLGTIVKIDPNNNFSATKVFDYTLAQDLTTRIYEENGFLYGTTPAYLGTLTDGMLYKISLSTFVFTVVNDFTTISAVDVYAPSGFLVSNNFAFCFSESEFVYGQPGVIKKINLSSGAIVNSLQLPALSGYGSNFDLVFAGNGSIYLTTRLGGLNGSGSLVKIDTATLLSTVVYNFPVNSPYSQNNKFQKFDAENLIGTINSSFAVTTNLKVFKYNTYTNQFQDLVTFIADEGLDTYGPFTTCFDTTIVSISAPNTFICNGDDLVISSQTNNLTYSKQWYHDNIEMIGQNSDELDLYNFTILDTGVYYCAINTPCGKLKSNLIYLTHIPCDSVYPGDANNDGSVQIDDFLNVAVANNCYGSSPPRPVQGISWMGYESVDWEYSFYSNVNYKYSDCNGDALIDLNDTTAILQNFNLSHSVASHFTPNFNEQRTLSQPYLKLVPQLNYLQPGQNSYFDIFLVNDSVNPIPVYGISFNLIWNNATVNLPTMNFNSTNTSLFQSGNGIQLQKKLSGFSGVAISRLDKNDTLADGYLGRFNFVTSTSGSGTINMNIGLNSASLMNHVGYKIPLSVESFSPVYLDFLTSISSQDNYNGILLVENHLTMNYITLRTDDDAYEGVLYNSLGQISAVIPRFNSSYNLHTDNLKKGVYFIELNSKNKRLIRKVIL